MACRWARVAKAGAPTAVAPVLRFEDGAGVLAVGFEPVVAVEVLACVRATLFQLPLWLIAMAALAT